ncbi:MAG TPA: copper-binding protein [Burkholderiales bacterium]|nr:copper-binding protein [Burkholderiales bacterium]
MKRLLVFVVVACVQLVASMVFAADNLPLADGEVVRVMVARKEILLRHGPIPHLEMGSMTMAFPVKDPAMLQRLKPGDKIRFRAEKVGDEAVITRIEPAK